MLAGRRLTVYIRSYCHLCEDMLGQLHGLQAQWGFELETVDIDGEPELERLHGRRVPVLIAGDREICHYFLDLSALQQYFSQP